MALKTKIFADTAFWKALVDQKDEFHPRAIVIFEEIKRQKMIVVITNFIIDEAVTLVRVRCGIERVREMTELWKGYGELKVERVMAKDELLAWEWFWEDWSKLSFTDCTSFAVMKRLGLTKVATFDDRFQKAGFDVIKYN